MQAKEIFESYGYETWVWKDDRPARGDLDDVMIAAIQSCDYFAYMCTTDSAGSEGQFSERKFAKVCGKQPFVFLVFDPLFLPDEYPPKRTIYNDVGEETFADDCRRAIERLQRERELVSEVNETEERAERYNISPMNTRDELIAAIKEKADRLDRNRLIECYDQVLQGYDSETIVENIAHVFPVPGRTPSRFHVLANSEARRIDHFNDSAYYWDFYCTQLGRTIALAEKRYVFEELQKAVNPEGEPISTKNPSFGALASAVSLLGTRGFTPDTLCAPIGLMVPFAGDASLEIDWNASPREVVILQGGVRLKLHWSSGSAPLDRFVVLDSSQMTWKVKPDPESGRRLTVAIGQSTIETGEEAVVFLAQTVAKFEVDPPAAVAVALEGEPLETMEYVNQEESR